MYHYGTDWLSGQSIVQREPGFKSWVVKLDHGQVHSLCVAKLNRPPRE